MCFKITTKCQKATKDIVCYKIISGGGSPYFYPLIIRGKYQPYKKGYHYTESGFDKNLKYIGEDNGFHSYKTIYLKKAQYGTKLAVFIIPKGSYYYQNRTEYYSQEIIYVKDYEKE